MNYRIVTNGKIFIPQRKRFFVWLDLGDYQTTLERARSVIQAYQRYDKDSEEFLNRIKGPFTVVE